MVAVVQRFAVRGEDVRNAENHEETPPKSRDDKGFHLQGIVWRNVILMALLHAASMYSIFLIPTARPLTLFWCKSEQKKKNLTFHNYSWLLV